MKLLKRLVFICIVFLCFTPAISQNYTELILDIDSQVTLQPQRTYTYSIQLPQSLPQNTDFYFVAQWPVRDPLQKPIINLNIEDLYNLKCSDENNQYSGVCSIPSDYLSPNSTILAQITCYVECELKLSQFISARLQLNLGDEMIFKSPVDKGIPIEIQIQIPSNANFTQIAIYAQILNFQNATGGLDMLANIGDYYVSMPTAQYSELKGESIYWGGKGIFISQEDISKGQWIKLYLFISEGMSVKFSSNIINGNVFAIDIEKAYFDFTSKDEDKLYVLDLTKKDDKIMGKTVGIGFIVYSGDPVIKISMDSNFNNKIQEKGFVSSSTYLITQAMRNQMNFTGYIYIKVESRWDSDYYFYTQIDEGNYMSLFPDINFYTKLQPFSIFNYFFEDIIYINNNSQALRNYSIKVEMIKGTAVFGVRHCRPAQNGGSPMNCIVNTPQEITDEATFSSFQQIPVTLQQSSNDYHLAFQINGSDCQLIKQHNAYYCYFHIVALQDKNNTSEFTVALNKRVYASALREGELSRNIVFLDQYLYFKFSLTSIDSILSITFYLTVLQGDVYLVSSITDQFPNLQSDAADLLFSSGNSLTYHRNQLSNTIYLAVYGLQLSQFTIGVQVTRASNANGTTINSTSINQTTNSTSQKSRTKLDLHLNLSQEFIFQQIETEATFLLNPTETMNITVEVIQLSGVINLKIIDENGTDIVCQNSTTTNNKVTCSFEGVGKKVYEATVTANKGQVQRFIILYYKSQQCIPYTLNLPLYLELSANEKECVYFTITKSTQIQVTTSVPLSNIFKQSFQMSVCLNEHCMEQSVSHHLQISKSQISSFCKFGGFSNSTKTQSCTIKLQIQTKDAIDVQLIVEEKGKDIGLFDGITEKVTMTGLSHTQGKYLYYDIYDWSPIKIFFTSLTTNSYYIAVHFIEEKQFLANTSNVYPDYRETKNDLQQDWSSNILQMTIKSAYTQLINIPSQAINKYCEQCLLAIAIYPWYVDSHAVHSFEIEVSQTQTLLFLGDSRIGLLEEYQIYNYQLEGSDKSDSLVMLRDLSRQSSSSQDCFEAGISHKASDKPSKLLGGIGIIKKGSKSANIYVSSYKDQCNYEITYMQLDIPLLVASTQKKYQVSLDQPSKSFLLYKHNSKQSFKIVQIINTGTLKVYAIPIINQTVEQLSKVSGQTFPYVSDDSTGELLIDNTTASFCSNCQYFIILQTSKSVQGEVMIANYNTSISLGINGIIKEKIKVQTENKLRKFSFYSITAFNVSINLIYGSFSVKILDPKQQILINETVSKSKVFHVPHNKQTQNFVYEYNSPFTKYEIIIEAISDCSFTIKASKTSISERLFEGLPTSVILNPKEKSTFEFLNFNEADFRKNSLNVLVQIIQTDKSNPYPYLSVEVILENNNGQDQNLPILSQTKSDNTFNIQISLRVGTYYLSLSFDQYVVANIILVKQSLIHLQPSTSLIMSRQQVFELYSQKYAAMIEVFQCWGQSTIEASSVYKDLEESQRQYNQIVLEQNNYGGHYVIGVDELYGEYFIKIKNKNEDRKDMNYLITYHYYEIGDILPYKLVDLLDREIIYSLSQSSTIFEVQKVGLKGNFDFIEKIEVEYKLYIADNKSRVTQYANCRLGEIESLKETKVLKDGTVQFEVDNNFIKKSINNQTIYFAGAEAVVYITINKNADSRYPKKLRLIYETIELTSSIVVPSNMTGSSYTVEIILMWFLLPFVLASIMLYFALKYCLGRYLSIPNELMEQDPHGQSNQAVQLANMNNASQSLKDQV